MAEQAERRAVPQAGATARRSALDWPTIRRGALRDDLDLDDHPRFKVTRYMAGELVAPRLGKRPLQFGRLSWGDVLDLRLPLLAVHLCFERFIDRPCRFNDELVHCRAFIANREDVGFVYPE